MPRETPARQPLCADIDGFSLRAVVWVEAPDRWRLEQSCRYITRPAHSDERVPVNAAGQVELKLKTPWRREAAALSCTNVLVQDEGTFSACPFCRGRPAQAQAPGVPSSWRFAWPRGLLQPRRWPWPPPS